MAEFEHLNAPYSFKRFYSTYPEGYSIYEALLDWINQVNEMTNVLNLSLSEWEKVKLWVNSELKTFSEEKLIEWLNDGTLESIIDSTFDEITSQLANMTKDTETISKLLIKYGSNAWVEALNYKTLIINQDVTKTGVYIIPNGQTIIFENNAIVTQDDELQSFVGEYDNWHIGGKGKIRKSGGKPTTRIEGSHGINITQTAFDWSISGDITIEHFADSGISFDGGHLITGRTGYASVSAIHCNENWDNFIFIDGFPAEYLTLSNCRSTYAVNRGVFLETGNVNWIGGSIIYNQGGVHLRHPDSGGNPHHGMFVGTNINHNTDYQLWVEKVAFGYDFTGCHFYDNEDPAKGRIKLDNCRGINITGGTIGCHVEYVNDGHAHVGYNRIAGNKIDRDRAIITGIGFDRTKLFVEDNFDNNGAWTYNDEARAFAQKYTGVDVALTGSGSYSVLYDVGSELSDNRNSLGVSYLAPFSGVYSLSLQARIEFSSAISSEYIWFGRDDTASGVWTELFRVNLIDIADSTGLKAYINFNYEFPVSKGGQITVFLSGTYFEQLITFKTGTLITIKSDK